MKKQGTMTNNYAFGIGMDGNGRKFKLLTYDEIWGVDDYLKLDAENEMPSAEVGELDYFRIPFPFKGNKAKGKLEGKSVPTTYTAPRLSGRNTSPVIIK